MADVTDRYLEAVRSGSDAFWAAIEAADMQARVPACPNWRAADLAWHLAEVHHSWATIVADRVLDPSGLSIPERPPDDQLVAFGRRQADFLLDALAGADPSTHVWTWAPQQDVAFVRRHQAVEAAVHRWDAESVVDPRPGAIDKWLAADAIDEFLQFSAPHSHKDASPVGGTLHLHATDADQGWLVEAEGRGPDAHLRGTASDLLLVLHRRLPFDVVEVTGDRDVAERFVARTNLD